MEKFSEDIKALAMKVINYEKKEMIPLTNRQNEDCETLKYCHICWGKFCKDENDKKYKNYHKVRDHDHYAGKFRGAAHSICNLRHSTTKEIPVISHNGSNCDYHFIINELAKRFGEKIDCLGENMEKYITLTVPIKKVNENGVLITYKLKIIDSNRLMPASLSDLSDNLSEINKQECKKCKEKTHQ